VETYKSIREWKDENITTFLDDTVSLNDFHDLVMHKVMGIAKCKMKSESPPCDFTWFITGSGGRFEQGVISDQDHGIVYAISNEENDEYFKKLGEELSYGLNITGYPYCQGNIMSSNPIWCKSFQDWHTQLREWMENESWENIRYLQIFFDARVLHGKLGYIHRLKYFIYQYQLQSPNLFHRFIANVMHVKNVIGPFGQILVEQHGVYQGCVNLKYAAFLPYVNSVRLLSIKEGIYENSTLTRMNTLIRQSGYEKLLHNCEKNFADLLNYRLSLFRAETYTDTHYLNIEKLSKEERKGIKRIIKDGKRFHDEVIAFTLSK
jgi:CBS domain-containing protein